MSGFHPQRTLEWSACQSSPWAVRTSALGPNANGENRPTGDSKGNPADDRKILTCATRVCADERRSIESHRHVREMAELRPERVLSV